jgi:biotin carboxyl carrier protein
VAKLSANAVRVALAQDLPGGPEPLVVAPDTRTADAEAVPASRRALILPMEPGPGQPSGVERREVVIDGWRIEVTVEPEARAALRDRARRDRTSAGSSGPTKVHAIIPGVVVEVSVAPGDAVTAGQHLLVIEAMKMQNELKAPRNGTILQVAVGAGSQVEVGDLLLELA